VSQQLLALVGEECIRSTPRQPGALPPRTRFAALSVVIAVGRGLVCGDLIISGVRWKVLYLPSIMIALRI